MRLLKLVGKIKQLQLIVMGLVKGMGAVTYILILVILVFYLYAVLGVTCFRHNDPWLFGDTAIAMITLYRIATFESWSMIMFLESYGCNSQSASGFVGVSTCPSLSARLLDRLADTLCRHYERAVDNFRCMKEPAETRRSAVKARWESPT